MEVRFSAKNVFGSVGLNREELLKVRVQPFEQQVSSTADKIELTKNKRSAYAELKGYITDLKDSTNILRKPPSTGKIHLNENNVYSNLNVFEFRKVTLSSNNSNLIFSNYLEVIAEAGTDITKYTITDLVKAKKQITTFSSDFPTNVDTSVVKALADAGVDEFIEGEFEIIAGVGGDQVTVTITLEEGDTLTDVAGHINDVSSETGVAAKVWNTGTSRKLILTSTEVGAAHAFTLNDLNNILVNTPYVTQAAADASMVVDDIPMTSSSNLFKDFVDGLTIEIKNSSDNGDVFYIDVAIDYNPAAEAIVQLVEKFNEIVSFEARQRKKDEDGVLDEQSYLYNETDLKSFIWQLRGAFGSTLSGMNAEKDYDLQSIFHIGVRTYKQEEETEKAPIGTTIYQVLPDILIAKIFEDFDNVRALFEFQSVISSSKLSIVGRNQIISATEFDLAITINEDDEIEAWIDDGENPYQPYIDQNTGRIIGLTGSSIAGLVMHYSGTGDATINVKLSQGIADKLYLLARNSLDRQELYDEEGKKYTANGFFNNKESSLESTISQQKTKLKRQKQVLENKTEKISKQLTNEERKIQEAISSYQQIKARFANDKEE